MGARLVVRDASRCGSSWWKLQSAGRQTVVIRMKYQSGSLRDARLVAQYGAHSVGSQQQHRSNVNLPRRPPVPITASGIPSGSPINDDNAGSLPSGQRGNSPSGKAPPRATPSQILKSDASLASVQCRSTYGLAQQTRLFSRLPF